MNYSYYRFKGQVFERYPGEKPRRGMVELSVDWDKLVRTLGQKAAFNKSGQSGLQLGISAKFFKDKEASS
jgi:hypothetical protein